MTQRELKKLSLLAEIAGDYYERGLSQNEIAERLCLSRTRVSRLLKEASEKGVVTVTINYYHERHYELERRIKDRYPINNVIVLNNRNRDLEYRQRDVSSLAAQYINESIKKDTVVGTSWGTTLAETVKFLKPSGTGVDVVQLMGSVPCRTPNCTPQSIVTGAADALKGHADFLNMPLYIEDDFVRKAICADNNNAVILNKGMFSDMILTSVSDVGQIKDKEFWLGYMTPEMHQEVIDRGAVGAMFARFFDKDGNEVDCQWNKKIVTISFDNIKNVPDVVVIAASPSKTDAIMAAVKGRLVNTLVIDGRTASTILGLAT